MVVERSIPISVFLFKTNGYEIPKEIYSEVPLLILSPDVRGNKSLVLVIEYAYKEFMLRPFLAIGFSK